MTTIATDGSSIAGDSLIVSGDLTSKASAVKIWRHNKDLYGCCGQLNDLSMYREWQNSGYDPDKTPELSESFSGLKVTPKGVYFFDETFQYHKGTRFWGHRIRQGDCAGGNARWQHRACGGADSRQT